MRTTSLLLLLAVLCRAEDAPLKGIKACNRAVKLMDEGKDAEALKVLEAAKGTMEPGDEWAWWGNCGMAHWDLRADDKALAEFRKAVELKKDCWFRVPCANLLAEFGKWDEALAMLDGPVDPDYVERAKGLRAVIEGPYRKKWPHAYRKLEYAGKNGTGHYCVVSDVGVDAADMDKLEAEAAKLDPKNAMQAAQLERLLKPSESLVNVFNMLEMTRKEYIRLTGIDESKWPKGHVSRVFFLGSQQEFKAFAKATNGTDEHENVMGFFDPNFKDIVLFNRPGSGEVCGIDAETLDTFWHEGWHQVFDLLTAQRPIWMNEGLAEFVGKGDVSEDGRQVTLGKLVTVGARVVSRYERIKEVLKDGKSVPFRDFFRFDDTRWEAGDVLAHYAQAWAVCFYAMKGDNDAFRKDFRKLFQELVKGSPWLDAVNGIFTDEKLDAYEKQWKAYMDKLE